MPRGPLYVDGYSPQLSGHETFPLRYGWLKKAVDAASAAKCSAREKPIFLADDAVSYFGVGKNMVASMRHWASATGMIRDEKGRIIETTPLGRRLFGATGVDPYMENPATAWLVHWQLGGNPRKTTWFWGFNHYQDTVFERDSLVRGIAAVAKERGWRASSTTIRSDVACFVRTYAARSPSGKSSYEDTLESPLTELGLIRAVGRRDGFRFVRGRKPSLGGGVFCYALARFWSSISDAQTLSFETLAHEPGSPGRVFLLDENELMDRLAGVDEASDGLYRWSETAGLKQIVRKRKPTEGQILAFLDRDYDSHRSEDLPQWR